MKRKTAITFGLILIAIIIVVRIALAPFVAWYVNRTLERISGYDASIDSIDIDVFRGAYRISGLRVRKLGGKVPLPLLEVKTTRLSVHAAALLEGKFVGRIDLDGGSLNFVNGRTPEEQQLSVTREWLQAVKDLFPLRVNHFNVNNFDIRYRDPYATPIVDVRISHVRIEGNNFSNTRKPSEGKEARIFGVGLVEGVAPLAIRAALAPSAKRPVFDLDVRLERLPLVKLNDLFKAYASFDVERGTGDFYIWINAHEGALKGTLKPLLHEVEVFSPEKENESLLSALWESLIGAAAEIFENKQEEQIGTVIPLQGDLRQVEGSTWTAIVEIVKNAFFQALQPGLSEQDKQKG